MWSGRTQWVRWIYAYGVSVLVAASTNSSAEAGNRLQPGPRLSSCDASASWGYWSGDSEGTSEMSPTKP